MNDICPLAVNGFLFIKIRLHIVILFSINVLSVFYKVQFGLRHMVISRTPRQF